MVAFYGWGWTVSRLHCHYEETVYFLPLSPQEFLILIWSTSQGWKAESTLEPPSGFEPGNAGLGIQYSNHKAIFDLFPMRNQTEVKLAWQAL